MNKDDKIAFKTHHDHYEFKVMSFFLTNSPSISHALINTILKPFVRRFVLMFFNDILGYNSSLQLHIQHLRSIL
jgi:hypothetical protein